MLGISRTRVAKLLSPHLGSGLSNFGPQLAASTMFMATATWFVLVHLWKIIWRKLLSLAKHSTLYHCLPNIIFYLLKIVISGLTHTYTYTIRLCILMEMLMSSNLANAIACSFKSSNIDTISMVFACIAQVLTLARRRHRSDTDTEKGHRKGARKEGTDRFV